MGGSAPIKEGEESVFIGLRFNESLVASVDELAAKRSMNRSALVREALRFYLEQEVTAS